MLKIDKAMLRLADAHDAIEIAEVFLASRKTDIGFAPLTHSDDDVRQWIREVLLPSGGLYVYREQGVAVGMLFISVHDRFSWVDQLYIHPKHVGRGYGALLLSFAKKELTSPIRLYTFQQNDRAIKFYQREGFRVVQLSDGSDNEERCPDVLMEWVPRDS